MNTQPKITGGYAPLEESSTQWKITVGHTREKCNETARGNTVLGDTMKENRKKIEQSEENVMKEVSFTGQVNG